MKTGLEGAKLPGRFQLLSALESERMGADGAAVVVDGGEGRGDAGGATGMCLYRVPGGANAAQPTQRHPHRRWQRA